MDRIRKIAFLLAGASTSLLLLGAIPDNGAQARHEATQWADMGDITYAGRTASADYGTVWRVEGSETTVLMDENFDLLEVEFNH